MHDKDEDDENNDHDDASYESNYDGAGNYSYGQSNKTHHSSYSTGRNNGYTASITPQSKNNNNALFNTPPLVSVPPSPLPQSPPTIINLFDSGKDGRFLVVCLLLDYGRKGEGAADLQAYLGDITMDFNGEALSCFVDEQTIIQIEA